MISFSDEGLSPERMSIWHRGDHSSMSWEVEQFIESSPYDVHLILPPSEWFRDRLAPVEMLHLEMLVRIRNEGGSLTRRFPSLIGNPHPRILMLGDVHNPNNDPWYHSAFGPWMGSGVWLLEALLTLAPDVLSEIALANAGEDNPLQMFQALDNPHVVALGRNAERFCAHAGIACGVVPHPQYVKRFLNSKRYEYANAAIMAALSGDDLMHSI